MALYVSGRGARSPQFTATKKTLHDTRVVLCLHHAAALEYKNAVVSTPDTDIFVILLYHAHATKLTVYLRETLTTSQPL